MSIVDKLSPLQFSRNSHRRLTLLIPDANTTYRRYNIHPLQMGGAKVYNHKYPAHIDLVYHVDSDSAIHDKVRFARMSAKLTQKALADLLGIDRITLNRLECGQVSDENMKTTILVQIAEICGLEKNFCCDAYHSFLIEYSERLTAFRAKYNIQQRELAELLGTSTNTIKRWESGRSKMSKDNYYKFIDLTNGYSLQLDEYHEFLSAGPAMIIRQFREEKGLTQARLAKSLGLAQPTINSWEQNRTKPTRDNFLLLSKAFKGEIGD